MQPPSPSSSSPFNLAVAQIKPSLRDVWKSRMLWLKIGLIWVIVSTLGSVLAATLAPDYSVAQWLESLQQQATFSAEGAKKAVAPIYMLLEVAIQLPIMLMAIVAVMFVASVNARQQRVPSFSEVVEAIKTCPRRFYLAFIQKGLWIAGPALLAGFLLAITSKLNVPIMGLIGLILFLIALAWSIQRSIHYLFLEYHVLFDGLGFHAAKERSTAQVKTGGFWSLGGAMLVTSIVIFVLLILLAIGALLLLSIITAILPSKLIGLGGGVLLGVILQILPTAVFISWVFRVWELSKNHHEG